MRRPLKDLRLLGPINFSEENERDICFERLCLDGNSVDEFMSSLRKGFRIYKSEAKRVYKSRGYEVNDICICGSVATGEFGLRSNDKVFEFLEGDPNLIDSNLDSADIKRLLDDTDTQCEFVNRLDSELDDSFASENLLSVAKTRSCSDIDIAGFIDIPKHDEEMIEDELFQPLLMEAVGPAEREIVGHMGIEPLTRSDMRSKEDCICDANSI